MKNMSKTGKFFVTCAVMFALGLVLTAGGCTAGGVAGIRKAVDGGEWSGNSDPVDTAVMENDYEFSSIEATGAADFIFVGSRYYSDAVRDYILTDTDARAGKVVVIYDKSKKAPEVKTEGDRLVIDAGKDNNVHLNDNFYGPKVIVFCSDEELESIKLSSEACDLDMKGISFKTADLEMSAGDVDLKDITSGGLKIVADAGDIDVSGDLKGITEVRADAGDIDIDVLGGIMDYTMDVHAEAGDLTVGGKDINGGSYTQKGGDDTIKVRADAGDIDIGSL